MTAKRETQRLPKHTPQTGLPEYTREELLAGSEALFAVKPEVIAGALFGSSRNTYSIEETGRLIRQFQQRKVQQ